MPTFLHRAHHCFAAGALAGLVTSVLIWIASQSGAFLVLGVPIVIELSPSWVYMRVVWGGMWGVIFVLPVLVSWPGWRRGLIFGLAPAAATLLLFNPIKDGIGLLGLGFGPVWPVLVVVFSLLWGVIAGWWNSQFVDFARDEP